MAPTFSLLAGGWVEVEGLPGWEAFGVHVRPALVSGEPRVVGLRLVPRTDDAGHVADLHGAVVTSNRLRSLPVSALAADALRVARLDFSDLGARLAEVAGAAEQEQRPRRATTTPERVAEVYRLAREAGQPPRATVCEVLHISSRTADRYISEARRRGLLPPYDDRKER